MEEVEKGSPPTSREWKLKAWRRCGSRMNSATLSCTVRQACSRTSSGAALSMEPQSRKGTAPSFS